ncbi:MAG: hypothetical protein LBI35_05290 [Burkholderiales bacterium]|jgi:hypothetical protein|nr:hypothetical protein [Burkholderiales bacterium]
MTPSELALAVREHTGTFLCSQINQPSEAKVVAFRHKTTPAMPADELNRIPDIGRLRDFYAIFGSILFYHDEKSGDAARYIAPIAEWSDLRNRFAMWIDDLSKEEQEEYISDWVASCLVIGEEPHSGNYVLMATEGTEAGAVFHFEHDGFEFNLQTGDLLDYAENLLDLDSAGLAYIATHMRFQDNDGCSAQWWIEELRDNRGNAVKTSV